MENNTAHKIQELIESNDIENIRIALELAKSQAITIPFLHVFIKEDEPLPFDIRNIKINAIELATPQLERLYDDIYQVQELEQLYINLKGKLSSANAAFIQKFGISVDERSNTVDRLDGRIGILQTLKVLIINNNNLESLPETFRNLTNLEELHLRKTTIQQLPKAISTLKKLKIFNAAGAKIQTLGNTFSNLPELEILSLSDNNISTLENNWQRLEQLKKLDLSNNNLQDLPASFAALKSLEVLKLDYNQFTKIPEVIFKLSKLRELYFRLNQIKEIPASIQQLAPTLKYINIQGNRHQKQKILALLKQYLPNTKMIYC